LINVCTIGGRLTRNCESRYSQTGTCFAGFTLAVDRDFKKADGTKETDFIDCKLIGKRAESLTQYLTKGKPICVTGPLQVRNYEDNQGVKRKAFEIVVDKLSFLPDAKKGNNTPSGQGGGSQGGNFSSEVDFSEDDIPF